MTLRRFSSHIASFFLLLSVSFIVPINYLHECESKTVCEDECPETSFKNVPDDCELCDLVFAPTLVETEGDFLPGLSFYTFFETIQSLPPQHFQAPYFHLRAPPLG